MKLTYSKSNNGQELRGYDERPMFTDRTIDLKSYILATLSPTEAKALRAELQSLLIVGLDQAWSESFDHMCNFAQSVENKNSAKNVQGWNDKFPQWVSVLQITQFEEDSG